jgi:hypothetical protein
MVLAASAHKRKRKMTDLTKKPEDNSMQVSTGKFKELSKEAFMSFVINLNKSLEYLIFSLIKRCWSIPGLKGRSLQYTNTLSTQRLS